jgi:putative hydrolase of the HAD superfamily
MSFAGIKVLTFDIVGTCIDFEKGVLDSMRLVAGNRAGSLADDDIFKHYLAGREKYPGRASDVMRNVLLHTAKELGLPSDEATGDLFLRRFFQAPPFPDSVEALKRLRAKYRLVAMTNYDRVSFTANSRLLGDPFHDSVTVDEAPQPKPDPQFYAYTLGRLSASGYKQDEIMHVAQSQYHDMEPGRALGYTICWIERRKNKGGGYGGTRPPIQFTTPDFHYTSLAELADAMGA